MKLQTYRRKDKGAYAKLQEFLHDLAQDGQDVPQVFELWSVDTAQIERLTFLATRKNRFEDQFNHQEVSVSLFHNTPIVIGVKNIIGQPRRVYLNTSFQDALDPRMFDWRPVGEQAIEVVVHFLSEPENSIECSFDVWGD